MGGHAVDHQTEKLATQVGAAIAAEGWILLTGGRDQGVMAAATRGARGEGGLTIGVHPGRREDGDQADADVIIFTGIGFARNMVNVLSSDAVIALSGSSGTLSEVAYARTYGVPTVLLGFDDEGWFGDSVYRAEGVEDAIAWVRQHMADKRLGTEA